MNFENQVELGIGIYTTSELSKILRIPYYKINRWIKKYWDGELGKEYAQKYSWEKGNSKAVGFHTLIEFYIFMNLAEAGVKTHEALRAHKQLSRLFDTPFPFAHSEVVANMKTDGKKLFFKFKDGIIALDGTSQFNLNFIDLFFKKLEFDVENLATRFWPLGKEKNIMVDPKRQFGHPVIQESNIYPETIYNLYKGKESIEYIAYLYKLNIDQVKDAIEYCKAA